MSLDRRAVAVGEAALEGAKTHLADEAAMVEEVAMAEEVAAGSGILGCCPTLSAERI
jgi:hypothetical protein